MSLNLKELEAEANRDGTMMSDDFLALLRALREARAALLWAKALHDRQSYVDGPNWAACAALIRTVLCSVVDATAETEVSPYD